jgi:hypothetical protein
VASREGRPWCKAPPLLPARAAVGEAARGPGAGLREGPDLRCQGPGSPGTMNGRVLRVVGHSSSHQAVFTDLIRTSASKANFLPLPEPEEPLGPGHGGSRRRSVHGQARRGTAGTRVCPMPYTAPPPAVDATGRGTSAHATVFVDDRCDAQGSPYLMLLRSGVLVAEVDLDVVARRKDREPDVRVSAHPALHELASPCYATGSSVLVGQGEGTRAAL